MASSNEQLHPNWRALATIHFPLKRFVSEGVADAERDMTTHQSSLLGFRGDEAQKFYDEMVTKESREKTKTCSPKKRQFPCSNGAQLVPFDRNKFFRYAMENNATELQKFNFQANSVNIQDAFGWTALMMAACEGAENAARVLLELGVDREARANGLTALDLAKKKGHWNIVRLLIQHSNSMAEYTPCRKGEEELKIEPFYCATCQRTFAETTQGAHRTSTVHQFNEKSSLPANKLQKFNIPTKNRGLQLMVKQGWDKQSGLGPSQTGRLYPVKTVIRKQRTGLGIDQPPARVTHFEAFDLRATQRHGSDYYKKKSRNRNDMRKEKQREWKRERRLRNELS